MTAKYKRLDNYTSSLRYVIENEEVRKAVWETMRLVDRIIAEDPNACIPDGAEAPLLIETTLLEDLRWHSDDLFCEIQNAAIYICNVHTP